MFAFLLPRATVGPVSKAMRVCSWSEPADWTSASLAADIHRRLRSAGDPERREAAKTYFPTAMEVLGAAVPDVRKVVRDVSKRLRGSPPQEVLSLALSLLAGGTMEGRQAASPGCLGAPGS